MTRGINVESRTKNESGGRGMKKRERYTRPLYGCYCFEGPNRGEKGRQTDLRFAGRLVGQP